MAHRTPGPENFALHMPKAQPNKGKTAICGILRITRTSLGASEFYFAGVCWSFFWRTFCWAAYPVGIFLEEAASFYGANRPDCTRRLSPHASRSLHAIGSGISGAGRRVVTLVLSQLSRCSQQRLIVAPRALVRAAVGRRPGDRAKRV